MQVVYSYILIYYYRDNSCQELITLGLYIAVNFPSFLLHVIMSQLFVSLLCD